MRLVDRGWLRAVVSMPSNIFATTGTNVSIVFIDKTNKTGKAVLVDASGLGTKIKDGKNQKTLLPEQDEQKIIDTVNNAEAIDGFSAVKTFDELKAGRCSFNPGGYFDVNIEHIELSQQEFTEAMTESREKLVAMFEESRSLEKEVLAGFEGLVYD
jgi:type I restriction enzyme M protein